LADCNEDVSNACGTKIAPFFMEYQ
jgi:hypothetical protein